MTELGTHAHDETEALSPMTYKRGWDSQYDAGRANLIGVEGDCRPRWKRGTQAKRPRSMPRHGWSRLWPRSRPASSWISSRNGGPRCPSWILWEKKWGWLDPYSLTALAQLSGYSCVTAGILQETNTPFADAEIWLMFMLMLKYCESKTLFHGWKVVLNKLKQIGEKAETPRPRGISKALICWRLAVPLQPPCMRVHGQPTPAPALAAYGYKRPLASKNARLHVMPRCGARRDGHTMLGASTKQSRHVVSSSYSWSTEEAPNLSKVLINFIVIDKNI